MYLILYLYIYIHIRTYTQAPNDAYGTARYLELNLGLVYMLYVSDFIFIHIYTYTHIHAGAQPRIWNGALPRTKPGFSVYALYI